MPRGRRFACLVVFVKLCIARSFRPNKNSLLDITLAREFGDEFPRSKVRLPEDWLCDEQRSISEVIVMNQTFCRIVVGVWLAQFADCPAQELRVPAKPAEPKVVSAATEIESPVEAELSNRRWREEAQVLLRKPTDLDFTEVALEEVVKYLADFHKASIRIDRTAIDVKQGFTPITVSAVGQPLSHVLNRMMQTPELAWTVHRGDIVITKVDALPLETRVYRIGRLLQLSAKRTPLKPSSNAVGPGGFGALGSGGSSGGPMPAFEVDPFSDVPLLLEQAIDAQWMNSDGVGGTSSLFGELLVIRQTYRVHEQITLMLRAVETALAREPGSPSLLVISPDDAPRWLAAQKALRRDLKLRLSDTPLEDVVKMLREQTEVDVFVDHAALKTANISESLLSLNLPDGQYPAHKAMQLTLEPHQLMATQDDGAIRITVAAQATKYLPTVIYDVADLLRSEDDVGTLISTLQEITSGPWKDLAGEGGTLNPFPVGLFVIRQSDSVHSQIALLLHELRQAKKELPKEIAKPLPSDLETKFHKAKSKDEATALEKLILTFVAPNSWDVSGGRGLLRTAEDRLIIQQTKAIQVQIEQFLREYQQATPIGPAAK